MHRQNVLRQNDPRTKRTKGQNVLRQRKHSSQNRKSAKNLYGTKKQKNIAVKIKKHAKITLMGANKIIIAGKNRSKNNHYKKYKKLRKIDFNSRIPIVYS